jgi:hypothetical protein
MRGGPSDSDCRVGVQTTGSGVGLRAGVVSVMGKGENHLVRCVLGRRTQVNRRGRVETTRGHRNQAGEPGLGRSSGGACRLSEWWPAYRRREPSTGVCMERGNLPPRCEGRSPSGGPARMSVPMRGGGTDRPGVAKKPGNAGGAKGPDGPTLGSGQPARGRAGA